MTAPARICPRCGCRTLTVHHRAPGDAEWQVLHCEACSFTWRTTEEPEVLDRALRPPSFRLEPDDRALLNAGA